MKKIIPDCPWSRDPAGLLGNLHSSLISVCPFHVFLVKGPTMLTAMSCLGRDGVFICSWTPLWVREAAALGRILKFWHKISLSLRV